ncbi:MAG: glycosyltransferase family 39 protein [Solirubrobacteraceae bacterium]|nr:glycosyltransferase family 39 protein [Solirubrobacteraceae bacterium]
MLAETTTPVVGDPTIDPPRGPSVWPSPLERPPSSPRLKLAERLGFAVLIVAGVLGFVLFPTYPNYDSIYSLLWGREILDLATPTFDAFRAPTQHPLSNLVGAVLSLFGTVGDRMWIALCIASLIALLAGLYRLGRDLFSPVVGGLAALLLASRLDFAFLAARGYIDTAFLAFVIWAAVLEVQKPRRGLAPLILLAFAGLLRPEAWLLAGIYWLWCIGPATWPQRIRWGILVWLPTLIWTGSDYAVMGEPLYSFTHTSGLAAELDRTKDLDELPVALISYLIDLDKLPVFIGGLVGAAVGLWLMPKRTLLPLLILTCGVGIFMAIGIGGFSVIDRYLLVAAVMVMLLCAVALGGWSVMPPGRLRSVWMVSSIVLLVVGAGYTATKLSLNNVVRELEFRGEARPALGDALQDPRTKAALDRCGTLYLPNHKMIPDARWLTDLPADRVLARTDAQVPDQPTEGVVLITHQRRAIFNQVLFDELQDPSLNLPPANFERLLSTKYYTVYVHC